MMRQALLKATNINFCTSSVALSFVASHSMTPDQNPLQIPGHCLSPLAQSIAAFSLGVLCEKTRVPVSLPLFLKDL